MNEKIDLTKILTNCPRGFKLYSIVHGEVTFFAIEDGIHPICVLTQNGIKAYYSSDGRLYISYGKCVLFPSEEQEDWSKFTAPWLKKEKFDPKTLKPFDKVIARNTQSNSWAIEYFSHIDKNRCEYYPFFCLGDNYAYCIPYNADTKHLLGSKDEAPEFYRYWEN